jgi:hypothetical protein
MHLMFEVFCPSSPTRSPVENSPEVPAQTLVNRKSKSQIENWFYGIGDSLKESTLRSA